MKSYIKGTVIEINESLLNQDYTILNSDPENNGFIFIVNLHQAKLKLSDNFKLV